MDIPFLYVDVGHPTWLFYAALLIFAVFFRFSRLVSVRNLDLSLILCISTALVLTGTWPTTADEATQSVASQAVGSLSRYSPTVLLSLSVLLIIRLILDENLTRRPRLEQNLNQQGLTFLCVPAFVILMTSVFMFEPPGGNVDVVESGKALLERQAIGETETDDAEEQPAPTETLIAAGASAVAQLSGGIDDTAVSPDSESSPIEESIARILIVMAHTIVVCGFIYIGRNHFNSLQLGISMSCLYLLLPCTAFKVHELSHVLPAACLVWAFACYRRPAVAGVLLGLACGTLFFAVFLLPLWAVFYGRKGSLRFGLSVDSVGIGQIYLRITLAAIFFVMLTAMTVIPRRRNLENLLANSTALVVAAQLWYPRDVGTYVLWYLPLLLMVMFRPRLDRFTPPEMDHPESATRRKPATAQAGGALSRVTLYH